jgi:hypothetical protein
MFISISRRQTAQECFDAGDVSGTKSVDCVAAEATKEDKSLMLPTHF